MEFSPRRLSKVIVVSRERLWAVAVRHLLEQETGLSVSELNPKRAGELSDTIGALEPMMVILDSRDGGVDVGAEVELVSRMRPGAAIVVVVGVDALDSAVASLRAGAVGILDSDASRDDLHATVDAVRQGELFLSQAILRDFVTVVTDTVRWQRGRPKELLAPLSPREGDVLERLTRGMSNAEIAVSLSLSQATVKLHLAKIMTKWGVRDRVQVVIRALGGDYQKV